MLKVGIIGCGAIAQRRHAPEYARSKKARLCAYYDADTERARMLANRYGGNVYESWLDLVEHANLDAVSVCAPNAAHAEITIRALERGLHVLCEKPMAVTLEQCEAMVRAARDADRLLFIGQNQRLAPAHVKARELIRAGAIGKPLTFQTYFGHRGPEAWTKTADTWFYRKSMAAHGALFDLGIHKLDLLGDLLGEPFTAVSAMADTLDKRLPSGDPIEVEDNAICLLRTRGGALGQMAASWTYYGQECNSTRIYGQTGAIHILEDEAHPLYLMCGDKRVDFEDVRGIQTHDDPFGSGIIDAFVEDVLAGGPARISGEEVLRAMRTVFAALESARTGRTVFIAQD